MASAVEAARDAYCKDRHPDWPCNQKSLEDEMVRRMLRAALEVWEDAGWTLSEKVSGFYE